MTTDTNEPTTYRHDADLSTAGLAALLFGIRDAAADLADSFGALRGAALGCAEGFRGLAREVRAAKRARQTRRTFRGRLPKGWRTHVRRVKAEERRKG